MSKQIYSIHFSTQFLFIYQGADAGRDDRADRILQCDLQGSATFGSRPACLTTGSLTTQQTSRITSTRTGYSQALCRSTQAQPSVYLLRGTLRGTLRGILRGILRRKTHQFTAVCFGQAPACITECLHAFHICFGLLYGTHIPRGRSGWWISRIGGGPKPTASCTPSAVCALVATCIENDEFLYYK